MRETGREFDGGAAGGPAARLRRGRSELRHRRHRRRPQARRCSSALAFGCPPDFAAVYTEGIRHVSPLDIAFASEMGYRIKLLGVARLTEHGLEQRVHPSMVRIGTPISQVEGVFNAVVAEGDQVDTTLYAGRGAGGGPTASAVVADLADIAKGAPPAGVRRAERAADAPAAGADGPPLRRLLFPPDGGGQAGRDGRRCGLPARPRGLDRGADPARAQSGRAGARSC